MVHGLKMTLLKKLMSCCGRYHCVKIVQIRSFSAPYFPAFGMNTEIYNLRIQSKYGKIWTRKTTHLDSFQAVYLYSTQ